MKKSELKNICFLLPNLYVEMFDILKENGVFESRSEGIRIAVNDFLKKEENNIKLFALIQGKNNG